MTHVFTDIQVTASQILNSQYSEWSKLFPDNIVKSKIIRPLPKEFIEYLESDSIQLVGDPDEPLMINSENEYSDWENDDSENDDSANENEDEENEECDFPKEQINPETHFKSFHEEIVSSIQALGGSVTPKLNWSMPKDARWILPNNSTRCICANDVYLLLNASDHIVHDLDHAFDDVTDKPDHPVQYELVLKKWMDINPALEFRVFVKGNKVIGISQRDLNFYSFLQEFKSELYEVICKFAEKTVSAKYPDSDFILDVYVPRPFNKVWIIDINSFSRTFDSLLYTWNELADSVGLVPEIRLIESQAASRFSSKEFGENYVPKDVVDASLDAASMAELVKEWKSLQVKEEENCKKK